MSWASFTLVVQLKCSSPSRSCSRFPLFMYYNNNNKKQRLSTTYWHNGKGAQTILFISILSPPKFLAKHNSLEHISTVTVQHFNVVLARAQTFSNATNIILIKQNEPRILIEDVRFCVNKWATITSLFSSTNTSPPAWFKFLLTVGILCYWSIIYTQKINSSLDWWETKLACQDKVN